MQSEEVVTLPGGGDVPTLAWRRFTCDAFDAEYATRPAKIGEDMVYHFFPPAGAPHFAGDPQVFAKRLEGVFKQLFPPGAPATAEFIQGSVTLRHTQSMLVAAPKYDRFGRKVRDGVFEDVATDATISVQHHAAEQPQDAWHITVAGFGTVPGALRMFGDRLMHLARAEFQTVRV